MEDHIYIDISVLNNDRTGQAQNAPVSYNEARNSNILTDPDNYYMSIVRAQVDTGGYSGPPLLLPLVNLNNSTIDQDQLIYTISTATKSGGTYSNLRTVNVRWNAQNQAAAPPNISAGIVTTTGYYNCFSVNWFVACMNAAFAGLAYQDGLLACYMFADPLTNLITIKTTPDFLLNKFMFFNEPLAALFNCFTMQYIGNSGLPFTTPTDNATIKARPYLLNYQLQFYKNNLETPDAQGFVSTTGLVSPVPAWSPILSVSFASNLIPHVLTNSTAAQSRTPSLNSTLGQSQISNIITDITVPLTSGNEFRPQILYTPAIYRMIDLHGTQSLNNLDLQLFYKDKYGVLTPMRLGAQQFFSAKLLFRRRRFDLLNLPPYDS